MRVLFLAPQPFFQERGTPIALKLLLEALIEQREVDLKIDLLTYSEGDEISITGVNHLRTPNLKLLSGIRPGISLKKLLYDLIFLFSALKLVLKARRDSSYHLIHTVEEAVFIGWLIKLIFKVPYVYDMDSSLSKQLTEKWAWLAPIRWILQKFENVAIRSAITVIPVCGALEREAINAGAKKIVMLRDVPVGGDSTHKIPVKSLRDTYGIDADQTLAIYVGNLEFYQGIELLLAAIKNLPEDTKLSVVIVGGPLSKALTLGETTKSLTNRVIFTGPQPLSILPLLLNQADILISPRLVGNNTPMKIYSYLASGKAILATDIESHTDVLTRANSILTQPEPHPFSQALLSLVKDSELRNRLGAQAIADSRRYSYSEFRETITKLYSELSRELNQEENLTSSSSTSFDLAS